MCRPRIAQPITLDMAAKRTTWRAKCPSLRASRRFSVSCAGRCLDWTFLINGAGVCPTALLEELNATNGAGAWTSLRGAHLCTRGGGDCEAAGLRGDRERRVAGRARGGIASSVSCVASKGGLLTATRS